MVVLNIDPFLKILIDASSLLNPGRLLDHYFQLPPQSTMLAYNAHLSLQYGVWHNCSLSGAMTHLLSGGRRHVNAKYVLQCFLSVCVEESKGPRYQSETME